MSIKGVALGFAVVVIDSALQLYLKYVEGTLNLDLPFLFVLVEMVTCFIMLGAATSALEWRSTLQYARAHGLLFCFVCMDTVPRRRPSRWNKVSG